MNLRYWRPVMWWVSRKGRREFEATRHPTFGMDSFNALAWTLSQPTPLLEEGNWIPVGGVKQFG